MGGVGGGVPPVASGMDVNGIAALGGFEGTFEEVEDAPEDVKDDIDDRWP